jgi:ankyrin repeat protein
LAAWVAAGVPAGATNLPAEIVQAAHERLAQGGVTNVTAALVVQTILAGAPDLALAMLLSGIDVNATNEFGQTPLLMASRKSDLVLMTACVQRGADIRTLDADRRGVLHQVVLGAGTNNAAVMAWLIEKGADPAWKDSYGCTPLLAAAQVGNLDALQALLDLGMDPTVTDSTGRAPLHYAAEQGRIDMAAALLASGCPVDVPSASLRTALHGAAAADQGEMTVWLLDQGANPAVQDDMGLTPLKLALKWNKRSSLEVLVKRGVKE